MSATLQRKIHEAGTGATVKGIKASLLKKITITVPISVDEQKKRVDAIDSLTSHLQFLKENFQRKINNYQALKSAILAQELQSKAA